MGVVTYFLLCGYTPFGEISPTSSESERIRSLTVVMALSDRDNQVEEIQAICSADYAFEPEEYWQGVSETGTLHFGRL